MLLMPPHPYGSQVQAYLAGAVAVPAPWTFPPEGRKPVRHAAQSQVDCLAARESAGSFARNRVLPPHALHVVGLALNPILSPVALSLGAPLLSNVSVLVVDTWRAHCSPVDDVFCPLNPKHCLNHQN